MSTTNLTRAEAAERSAALRVESYDVDLNLTAGDTEFGSTTTVRFTASAGSATWLDLIAPAVESVTLNGVSLDPAEVFAGARIALPDLAEHNEVVVVARCAYMHTGEGMHRFVDPVDGEVYLYTQFESADARRVYACFEQPDLKATFALTVTAPDHWQVVSNAATPQSESVRSGVARWEFGPTGRISTYITAIVAGPYYHVHSTFDGAHGSYPLGIYCRASLSKHLDEEAIFDITRKGFKFFEGEFSTPYAFGKYDQLFVPEFNAGAMENAGCVTFHEDMVFRSRVTDAAYEQRSNTILHEMAHMWFGDLVTMTWWDDLWLNESFAEWASHHANVHATRWTEAWTSFGNQRKAWAYRQDQLPSTHPIAADMVDLDSVRVNFDGITYAKGASALRQLVAWVGEAEFLAGLRAYFVEHAWGNTRLQDLLAHLEAASGRDLSEWTEQWLQTSGVNLLRPIVETDEAGMLARVAIVQEPPSAPDGVAPTLRSHRAAIGLYDRTPAGLERSHRIELDVTGPVTEVPELTGLRRPELLLLNDDDLTFAKIRLDEVSLRTAIQHFADLTSSLPRMLIWGAAWDMTRDAEMATTDYVRLAMSGLARESDVGVVQQVCRQVRTAIDVYAAPDHRTGLLREWADRLWELADAADAASDHQLAYVRTATSASTTPEQLGTVRAVLTGDRVLPGLAVDTDLRWALLHRLVATDQAQPAEIDAELARDDTATGRRHATSARAAVPTAQAKAAAWESAVHDLALPNALLTATVGGFVQPDQRELLRPYVDRYFQALAQVWEERTIDMAQTITMGLYPALVVEPETVAATDTFLATTQLSPGAQRLVIEGRDGVLRALRAQMTDA